jgi:hypothetical protein
MAAATGKPDDHVCPTAGRRHHLDPEDSSGTRAGKRPAAPTRDIAAAIPEDLYEEISVLAISKGFRSVSEFVVHLLRDEAARRRPQEPASGYSARELQLIRKLLQGVRHVD